MVFVVIRYETGMSRLSKWLKPVVLSMAWHTEGHLEKLWMALDISARSGVSAQVLAVR